MAIGGTKCLLVGSPKINQPLRHRTEDNMRTLIPTTAVLALALASGCTQPAPGYSNPYYNSGYAPAPSGYGYSQPVPNYNQPRYTTVTVTNRGQNGNRDDVVQQQVVCGSQYYDGYRTRTARC
jgi:hypothetical protein